MGRWSRHLELATRGCGECKMLQCYATSVLQYSCSDVAARYVSELPDEMPALDQRSEIRNQRSETTDASFVCVKYGFGFRVSRCFQTSKRAIAKG